VKEGEEDLILSDERPFRRLRFLDFNDELGAFPKFFPPHRPRPFFRIGSIGNPASLSSRPFDENFVPLLDEPTRPAWNQGDSKFLFFDFLGDADSHGRIITIHAGRRIRYHH